jgi:XLF-Cernunnos, XRcc4-like factor, NHEJ component
VKIQYSTIYRLAFFVFSHAIDPYSALYHIMASQSSPAWRRLPVREFQQSRNPIIFFTLQRYEKGLKLQTTDLVHLWKAAKTSVEELKQEAVRTRCSIDPSEDEEQLEILIGKLEEAMSGRNGGSVRLVGDRNAPSPVSFEIETSIPLPTPLGMLEWTFRMVRQEPSVFTSELVLPALLVIEKKARSEQGLLRKIKEKDHIIGKLMDKIEGAGIDLSMVFPGFAGARKGLTARQAAEVVPGIEPFREDERVGQLKVGDDDGGVREIVKALKDSETEEMVWKGSMTSVMESNSDQSRDLKQGFAKTGTQNQVRPRELRQETVG